MAVPTYARTPSSTAITPVLEDLTALLGPQFESLRTLVDQFNLGQQVQNVSVGLRGLQGHAHWVCDLEVLCCKLG